MGEPFFQRSLCRVVLLLLIFYFFKSFSYRHADPRESFGPNTKVCHLNFIDFSAGAKEVNIRTGAFFMEVVYLHLTNFGTFEYTVRNCLIDWGIYLISR